MRDLRRRLKRLESQGMAPAELVRAWLAFLGACQRCRGGPELTPAELFAEARARAAEGWTPAQAATACLEGLWAEEDAAPTPGPMSIRLH